MIPPTKLKEIETLIMQHSERECLVSILTFIHNSLEDYYSDQGDLMAISREEELVLAALYNATTGVKNTVG